jgi:hypothetical protein
VRWKGYGPEDDQWKLRSGLIRETPAVVAEFDALDKCTFCSTRTLWMEPPIASADQHYPDHTSKTIIDMLCEHDINMF